MPRVSSPSANRLLRFPGVLLATSCLLVAVSLFAVTPTGVSHADDGVSQGEDQAAAWVKRLPPAPERSIDYVKDVRPILQASCVSCHGAEMQEGGLRLDVGERALEGGDSGRAITPKKLSASPLLARVLGDVDDYEQMPPDGEGRPLNSKEIGILRAWIEQGAVWPAGVDARIASEHWSLQPIERPQPPQVKRSEWVRNPIDAFILARLESEGVKPSPAADRSTLIRRVYLDVLGLPPSPEAVQAFLADDSSTAYEKVIEDVLASKHYGERWGRHWLDLARYADSDGYEKDRPRPHAWRYREWVINALNADMPFDQFSIAQIAGDLLPDADTETRVATGFHRNTLHNTEGGTDKEEDRVKKTVDRTNTVGSIWLGLTVGCAQCHTHKYDPITQREYFSVYAFFNNIDEKDIPAPLADERRRYEQAKSAHDSVRKKLAGKLDEYRQTQLPDAARKWAAETEWRPVHWETFSPKIRKSRHGAKLDPQADGALLATGPNKLSDVYTLRGAAPRSLNAIRLEVLPHKSLVKQGPGRAKNGNFVLTTLSASLHVEGQRPQPIKLSRAEASFEQMDWEAAEAINDKPTDGWAISPQMGKPHTAMFVLKQPLETPAGAELEIVLDQTYSGTDPHNLGHFRVSLTAASQPRLQGVDVALVKAFETSAEERSEAQWTAIENHYASLDKAMRKLQADLAAHDKKTPKPPATMAQATIERGQPRETRIHIRGDFLSPGEPVTAKAPAVLPAIESSNDAGPNRLDFARWLFEPENPLTARVTANRIWQRYFGVGLVETADDFGTQGEPPSHPQLLDWLASELRDHNWSLKQLHRLILNSAVYRQSSAARPELDERDPQNRWLARQNRYRVEAEIIRDLALAASGLLDERVGGPSVRPPQPTEYSKLTYANSARWAVSKGGDRYRRGLYTFFQRTSPYPMLMTFDSPDSTACTVQRPSSNTPLQALTLWNDPVFFECAQHLGRRILQTVEGQGAEADRARIEQAFLIALSRRPSDEETAWITGVLDEVRKLAASDEQIATGLTKGLPATENESRIELAAWVAVGRVLINVDEFIAKE